MAKSRPFSIYLLKEGVSIDDALVDNHNLEQLIPGNIENNIFIFKPQHTSLVERIYAYSKALKP